MRTLLFVGCNLVWISFYFLRYLLFQLSLYMPKRVQTRHLYRIIRRNHDTCFGKARWFERIRSIQDFQQYVPLSSYESYLSSIDRMGKGEQAVLTKESITLFELSSGTTSASKWIPYTRSLKKEFNDGIGPWLFDMYRRHKALLLGPSYWSITPLADVEKKYTPAGIPIGFEEDAEYFGKLEKFLINIVMAVPSEVKLVQPRSSFRYITLFFLLKERQLAFMSVWNPTFLSLLFADMKIYWVKLIGDIERGSLTLPEPIPEPLLNKLTKRIAPDRKRALELKNLSPDQYPLIWPKLKLVSCWTDGNSTFYAEQLKKELIDISIEGKGLIATEAFISFPCGRSGSPVLAIRSHFFEFIEAGTEGNETKLAHELEIGKRYEVVVTTGGGFYRYCMNDLVEVIGFAGKTPRIRFIGKADKVSDQFGEKLHEYHVSELLGKLTESLSPLFIMLAPDFTDSTYHYTLYIETEKPIDAECLLNQLENGLCENFHYAYCRKLGQLAAPKLFWIQHSATETYLLRSQELGQKLGNIKPSLLHAKLGWSEWFEGSYLN